MVQRRLVIRRPTLGVVDYRDPVVRAQVAAKLGAAVDGERAYHIRCPNCGRDDVYFFLQPERRTSAKCNHERGCGWSGPLAELE